MVAGSFTKECTSPVALERLWKAGIQNAHNLMPKLMPDHIASIDILEGDGGVGTIKQFNFAVKEFKYVKDHVEVLDDANHFFKYSIIEGGLIGLRLKSYSFELKFEVGSDGGSVAKIKVEYDTLDDTLLGEEEQEQITSGVWGMMKGVEGYLLADPTAYA